MVWQVLEQRSLPTGLVRAVSKVQTVADKSLKPVGSRVRWIIWALGVLADRVVFSNSAADPVF